MCAAAFCEDHLPAEAQVIVTCTRFQNFGQAQPKQVRTSAGASCSSIRTHPRCIERATLLNKVHTVHVLVMFCWRTFYVLVKFCGM